MFVGVISSSFILPLVLLAISVGLAVFRFWGDLRAFDTWTVDEWLRTRRNSFGIRDWLSPYQAAEHYCNPAVIKMRADAADEMNAIMMSLVGSSGHLDYLADERNNVVKSQRPMSQDHKQFESAQTRYSQCNTVLARELLFQLIDGRLIAKGLLMDGDVARSERVIPTSRWRILSLDIAKAEAGGNGWKYSGIILGKKLLAATSPPHRALKTTNRRQPQR